MTQPKTGDSTAMERSKVPKNVDGHKRNTRLLTLEHLDQRTVAARRVREMIADLCNDLGGAEHISTAQRTEIERAAVLCALCEDAEARLLMEDSTFNLADYLAAANNLRRHLQAIGLERKARDAGPTLTEYLEQRSEAGNDGNGSSRRTK